MRPAHSHESLIPLFKEYALNHIRDLYMTSGLFLNQGVSGSLGATPKTAGATVQLLPDPLEADLATALGLEHFADALQASR